MPKQNVFQEAYSFTPSSLIELWKLDGTPIGLNTIYYFCNASSANYAPIVYNSITYVPFPMQVDGMETDGKGTLPRPRITLSNINGFVSSLLLQNNQLVGSIVTRTRVFARFLDAANFQSPTPPWVTPDASASYDPDIFYVNRKITENAQVVSFELASVLDVQNVKLPRRQILANSCQWKYRSAQCGYIGAPIADVNNKVFGSGGYGYTLNNRGQFNISSTYNQGDYVYIYSSLPQFTDIQVFYVCTTNGTIGITPQGNPGKWIPDSCGKLMSSCKMRFTNVPLRTSAFPGVARAPFIAKIGR